MLLPLYSYWRYRKVYAEDQDEYVSRIRDGGQSSANPHKFIIQSVANGLPLETIVGCLVLPFLIPIPDGRLRVLFRLLELSLVLLAPRQNPGYTEHYYLPEEVFTDMDHSTARTMYITQQKSAQATPVLEHI